MQRERINHGVLWASSFLLSMMIIVQLNSNPRTAFAESVNTSEGVTLLTASNGQGTDFLYVIDNNAAMLLVYSIPDPQNKQFIKPEASWLLPSLFQSVRN